MSQPRDSLSSFSHEITRELLGSPRLPQRRCSFGGDPHIQCLDRSQHIAEERRPPRSSGMWTTLSRETWSEEDEVRDRQIFVEEYNRLATMHNVQLVTPGDCNTDSSIISEKPSTWISRILRRTSSTHSNQFRIERQVRHKRSISDISLRRSSTAKNTLKDKNLEDLVRLCGLNLLYLPTEYAPCSLAVPTCFRATAQYLVQHGPDVPGIFRIPGSNSVVAALYNHYCTSGDEEDIAGPVRCPTLPNHIKYDVHDVASAFKRFLSGVPGGILGSLALFNVFVSIQNQLHTDPELPTRRRSLIRSRLIALAIATLKSQYRRELICAVFGLLSMIGCATESNSSVEHKETLPITDLMGYGPLGIVFGPLLIGDLLDNYNMRLPNPYGGLILLPITPPKSRKERQKERQKTNKSTHDALTLTTHMDKVKIVNSITEMLIIHWRDVVGYLKASQALRVVGRNRSLPANVSRHPLLRPSASEAFAPRAWDNGHEIPLEDAVHGRSKSQTVVKRRLSAAKSMSALSRTVEERMSEVSVPRGYSSLPLAPHTIPDARLDDCMPAKSRSTTNSDHDSVGAPAKRLHKSGPKVRDSPSRCLNRPLRLSRKQSTRSLPDKYAPQHEVHASANATPYPKPMTCNDTSQSTEDGGLSRSMVAEPKLFSSDPGCHGTACDRYSNSSACISIKPQAGQLLGQGPAIDHLRNVSTEDLLSLGELARVLLQGSDDSEIRPLVPSRLDIEKDRDVNVNDIETTVRNSAAIRKECGDSSPSSIQKLFSGQRSSVSKGHESSASSSSPLSILLSRRRGRPNKQNSSKMSPIKLLESGTTSDMPESSTCGNDSTTNDSEGLFRTDLSKTAAQHRGIDRPIRASPRGTVKALVAKFSHGISPLAVASPATKSSVAGVRVNQDSPKGNIVSPYTRNPPSPTRSQKSGTSDRKVREVRSPPKAIPQLSSLRTHPPFHAPVSQHQVMYSTNEKPPSHKSRRSVEIIGNAKEISAVGSPLQAYLPCNQESTDTLVAICKPVKEAGLPQLEISKAQMASNNPVTPTGSVGQRKSWISTKPNSVLHGQIQALQHQLDAKTEEARQLRQQLEARGNPDVGTLAENVMEARREAQFWKSRAELLEKHVEMMRKTPARTSSGQGGNRMVKCAKRLDHSTTNYSEDASGGPHRNPRFSHGLDGAASWIRRSPERSSGNGRYDLHRISSTSENSNWMEQTMKALHTTES